MRRLFPHAPGFSAAPLGLDPGWVPPRVAGALGLSGLEPVAFDTPLTVAAGPGAFLTLSRDAGLAAAAIGAHSQSDAAKWPAFTALLRALAGFLEVLYQGPAPDVDVGSLRELLPLLTLGRAYRSLGRRDMVELLRTLPLSVWELVDDWFEYGPLKAAVAAGGVQDLQQGPDRGHGDVLLHHLVGAPAGSVRGRCPGWGPGASPGRGGRRPAPRGRHRTGGGWHACREGRVVTGVVLADGERSPPGACSPPPIRAHPTSGRPVWPIPSWCGPRGTSAIAAAPPSCSTPGALPHLPGLGSRDALAAWCPSRGSGVAGARRRRPQSTAPWPSDRT